jgi:hypothetical protein
VRLPEECGGATAVYADDFGGVWVVLAGAQEVYYYAAHTLAATMAERPATLPSCAATPAPTMPQHTLAFRCDGRPDAPPEDAQDRVLSVLFFNSDTNISASAQRRRDSCIVTEGGTMAFLRVPTAHDEIPVLLQPYQEVHLNLQVCAATAAADAIILCCFDGEFTEVVRAVVVGMSETSPLEGRCAHHSDAALPDALCTCEVEATGQFRVQGRIHCVLHDDVHGALITVSDAGNVDVWDTAHSTDVTAQFGSPAWDVAKHGTATYALICRDKLWIGLTSGQLLVYSFVHSDRRGEGSPAAAAGMLLRSHSSPIAGVLAMSMQSSVWSCVVGNGRVNVWDAADASFRGSFVFPESGIHSWHTGAMQLRTALWGVDGASGEPCLLQVSESLSEGNAYACDLADTRTRHTQEALLKSYRVCWRSLLRRFGAVRRGLRRDEGNDEALSEASDEGEMTAALQYIDADEHGLEGGGGAAVAEELLDTMTALHRLCVVDRRAHGGRDRAVDVVLEDFLREWQCRADTRDDVVSFLRFVNTTDGRGSKSKAVHSLEDAQDEFTRLYGEVEELRKAVVEAEAAAHSRANEEIASATAEATAALRNELESLREAWQDAAAQNEKLATQLQAAHAEMQSSAEQQTHLTQLLEDAETQLAETRKSLLATKRAAEVTASEVSSLFEMESKLHESQQVIAELSTKHEALVAAAEAKDAELRMFLHKQTAAKTALQSLLQAQNAMADNVGDFADVVVQLITDVTEGQRVVLGAPLRALLDAIQEQTRMLETSMESRLREQKKLFHTLSQELNAAVT